MKNISILLFLTLQFHFLLAQEPVSTTTQQISLKAGWNIVSFHVVPDSSDVKAVFQPLINESALVKVQDENGNCMEDLGLFGGWINYIGNISLSEGYKVKVSRDCQLGVEGVAAALPFDIPLRKGWNLIGFPRSSGVDGTAVIKKLIDSKTLVKIQDETGNSIEDMGSLGGWTNNIGKLMPGEGYKIKTTDPTNLTVLEKYSFYTVSIYGRVTCGYTRSLQEACTNAGIKYTFYDYDLSYLIREEFWKIVNEFQLGDYSGVGLPVVLVETENGRFGFEQPSITTIKAVIGY